MIPYMTTGTYGKLPLKKFIQQILSVYFAAGTLLEAGNIAMNKSDPVLMKLAFDKKIQI